jgi:hypothetical protein
MPILRVIVLSAKLIVFGVGLIFSVMAIAYTFAGWNQLQSVRNTDSIIVNRVLGSAPYFALSAMFAYGVRRSWSSLRVALEHKHGPPG